MKKYKRILTEDQILRLQQPQLRPAIILTVVLVFRLFMLPLTHHTLEWFQPMIQIATSIALIYMAATTRRHLLVAFMIGVPGLICEWLNHLNIIPNSYNWIHESLQILLILYVFYLMLRQLFTASRVNAATMIMAVNCYLLIGLVWTMFYILTELLVPGSFNLPDTPGIEVWQHLYYFSFITLTTLGYGDISPALPLARSLAMMEAIAGVLFTGVLMARLIGLYAIVDTDEES